MVRILLGIIIVILNLMLEYIDDVLGDLSPLAFYIEDKLAKVSAYGSLDVTGVFDYVATFGLLLLTLKLFHKIFITYILGNGDPDLSPFQLLVNFCTAILIIVAFPELYDYAVEGTDSLINALLRLIADGTHTDDLSNVVSMLTQNIFNAILGLIFFAYVLVSYINFLGLGFELLILRASISLAAVGVLDSDGGVFKSFIQLFWQALLTVVVQLVITKLAIAVCSTGHILLGIAAIKTALKSPKILQSMIINMGGNGGGVTNVYYAGKAAKTVGTTIRNVMAR
jgi:hypothetical protein